MYSGRLKIAFFFEKERAIFNREYYSELRAKYTKSSAQDGPSVEVFCGEADLYLTQCATLLMSLFFGRRSTLIPLIKRKKSAFVSVNTCTSLRSAIRPVRTSARNGVQCRCQRPFESVFGVAH